MMSVSQDVIDPLERMRKVKTTCFRDSLAEIEKLLKLQILKPKPIIIFYDFEDDLVHDKQVEALAEKFKYRFEAVTSERDDLEALRSMV